MSRERNATRYPGCYWYQTDKGKRYGATAELRKDWRTGRRRTLRKEGFATEREARAWRDTTLSERDGPVYDGGMTLGEWWTRWLSIREREIRPSSLLLYRQYLRWSAPLAGLAVRDLSPVAVQETMFGLLDRYAPYSVKGWLTCLRSVLAAAVDAELIAKNPASRVKGPGQGPKPTPIWTADELRRFLSGTADSPRAWGLLWRVLAETWVRVGELTGLEWGDVDLDAGTVTVRRTTLQRGGQTGPTKTGAERVLPISAGLVALLAQHRDRRRIEVGVRGQVWGAETPVFGTRTGKRLTGGAVFNKLRLECERLDVPVITPHGIRHTGATVAYHSQLIDEVTLSKRLGHASLAITMAVYVKPDTGRARKAANDFASLLDVG